MTMCSKKGVAFWRKELMQGWAVVRALFLLKPNGKRGQISGLKVTSPKGTEAPGIVAAHFRLVLIQIVQNWEPRPHPVKKSAP